MRNPPVDPTRRTHTTHTRTRHAEPACGPNMLNHNITHHTKHHTPHHTTPHHTTHLTTPYHTSPHHTTPHYTTPHVEPTCRPRLPALPHTHLRRTPPTRQHTPTLRCPPHAPQTFTPTPPPTSHTHIRASTRPHSGAPHTRRRRSRPWCRQVCASEGSRPRRRHAGSEQRRWTLAQGLAWHPSAVQPPRQRQCRLRRRPRRHPPTASTSSSCRR
mmetsp:Transcript_29972/g.88898  ORF Transcript_29972/g.88898 Transcript_29972/m.88898 type:complete len:214 (+) Transcript_29972:347-988(+)